jgi:hypothetical protein
MHRAGLVPFAACVLGGAGAGCGTPATLVVPPVVDIPVPPAASAKTSAAVAAPASSASATGPPAPWVERAVRTEVTKPVGHCQIVPFSFGSTIAVESRLVDGGQLAMRVVQDDETAKGITALPTLLGKGYVVDATGAVRGADGTTVPDDQVTRIRALAASFVGWPGAGVAANPPAMGAEVPSLEAPVVTVAAVPLHGTEPAQQATAVVRFSGKRAGDAGDELVFDVTLKAAEGDAGMCHHWTNDADLKGELRLRAPGGAMLALHLEGTTVDSEGLCQDPSGKPGPPPPPHTCNKGKVSVEVKQPRVP